MLKANAIRTALATATEALDQIGAVLSNPFYAEFPEHAAPFLIPDGESAPRGWYYAFEAYESHPRFKGGEGLYTFRLYGVRGFTGDGTAAESSAQVQIDEAGRIFEALALAPGLGIVGAYLTTFRVEKADSVFQTDLGLVNLFEASVLVDWGVNC